MRKIKNRLSIFYSLLALTALTACSPINSVQPFDQKQAAILLRQFYKAKPSQQMMALKLPDHPTWKKVNSAQETLGAPLTLIPTTDQPNDWHERIESKVIGYIQAPHIHMEEVVKNNIKDAKKHCNKVNDAILARTTTHIIFTLDLSDCRDLKNQKQIGKVLAGKDGIYIVRYSAVTGEVAKTRYNQIAYAIKNAKLVKNPAYRLQKK